jgi:hypothetical protein
MYAHTLTNKAGAGGRGIDCDLSMDGHEDGGGGGVRMWYLWASLVLESVF